MLGAGLFPLLISPGGGIQGVLILCIITALLAVFVGYVFVEDDKLKKEQESIEMSQYSEEFTAVYL